MNFATLQRINYNSGPNCLNADHVVREFERYHRPMAELQNHALHGEGIIAGLNLARSADQRAVIITAGAAFDPQGRMIVLSDQGRGQISGSTNPEEVPLAVPVPPGGPASYTLTIEFAEVTLPMDGANPGGCKKIEIRPLVRLSQERLQPGSERVFLGQIEVGSDGLIAEIRTDDRVLAITAESVQTLQQSNLIVQQRLTELDSTNSETKNTLATLKGELATTATSLFDVRNVVSSLQGQIAGLMTTVTDQQNQISNLKRQLQELAARSLTRKQSIKMAPALVGTWLTQGNRQVNAPGVISNVHFVATGGMAIQLPNLSRIQFFRAEVELNLPGLPAGGVLSIGITRKRGNLSAETVLSVSSGNSTRELQGYPTAGMELVDNDLFAYSLTATLVFPPITPTFIGSPPVIHFIPVPVQSGIATLVGFHFDCVLQ